ncbi:DUF2058 family protein [Luteimonas sp. 50]|uniref:DUF2058 family protein n=1 Tax=Cognatiluteimonas sedimenti TaxID=2927791 RepID=A0ABT0A1R0_9GAMM|nr:DUF2058 family protein [Lysobacter sedimenti]MCJ0824917.1 DUF2058 family protein [Lysobacter sedimenti]
MSDSLRDQLLGLGFKPPARPERKPVQDPARKSANRPRPGAGTRAAEHPRKPAPGAPRRHEKPRPPHHGKRGTREDIDLAKAYAIRAQKEKDDRIEAERLKQEQARQRREAKARLAALLDGKALNDPAAEIARHFDYGGKIKRIHVNEAQLKALNAGELGVVQLDGRYLLVEAALLAQAEAIFAAAVALKVDAAAPVQDDPYADPRFQVPDDLVW